jgi:hypothetical protein
VGGAMKGHFVFTSCLFSSRMASFGVSSSEKKKFQEK